MSIDVPSGWEGKPLAELAEYHNGRAFKPTDFTDTGLPVVRIAHINNPSAPFDYYSGDDVLPRNLIDSGDILFSWSATLKAVKWTRGNAILNQHIFKVVGRDCIDDEFLLQTIDHAIMELAEHSHGTTMKHIKKGVLKVHHVGVPPLPEQKKIAEVLGSVDAAIAATEAVIAQTRRVKQGLLTDLLTKGIGHTKFKQTDLGQIPESWALKNYGSVTKVVMDAFQLEDDTLYSPVVVRRRHNGVETRETKPGKQILVKQQYFAVPGTFLISRRQIIHRSCGLVPEGLGQNAIISKEYLALSTSDELDVRYLDYFSQTERFQKQVVLCSYGVDIEKFVFKDKWWMKELIPIPPIEEQRQICTLLDTIEDNIQAERANFAQLKRVKKGLMADLLTGKKRVTV